MADLGPSAMALITFMGVVAALAAGCVAENNWRRGERGR